MDRPEIYQRLKQSPANIRFEEITGYARDFGFRYKGGEGSHRVFSREGIREILTFQNVKGMVKPYQVRQFVKIIEKYHLLEDIEDDR